jgi:hypothetical protein
MKIVEKPRGPLLDSGAFSILRDACQTARATVQVHYVAFLVSKA